MSRRLYMSGAVWKGFYRSNVIGKVFCGAVWKGFYQSNSGNCTFIGSIMIGKDFIGEILIRKVYVRIPMSCKSKEVNNTTCLQDYKLIDLSHYELKLTGMFLFLCHSPLKYGMPYSFFLRCALNCLF
uniref:Uncharacterized protein n=1 Tax=Oryza nivara TaxID=4536 RepID=A0A0E0IST2_ORYNI